jgi:uridine kinase
LHIPNKPGPFIYFITGASGVGKTTLLAKLNEKYRNKPWAFFHFDSIGVPSLEEMHNKFGSPSAWQEASTHEWINKLINHQGYEKVFLEGQSNLKFIRGGFEKFNFRNYKIVLIDCDEKEMGHRLSHSRSQPELFDDKMRN